MDKQRFASVWDAIEDTPGEAENLKLRSALMIALKMHIEKQGWSQSETAQRLGVTQPRVSDLMRGKINLSAWTHSLTLFMRAIARLPPSEPAQTFEASFSPR